MRKSWKYALWGLTALSFNAWAEENALPKAFSSGRYTALRQRSPFAVPTTAPPPVAQPSFAANWFVSGIAKIGDIDYVTIKGRDQSAQFSLFGSEPNSQNQVTLVSVDWVDGIGKSTVTIKKGSEIAKLEFNEAVVHGAPQGATAQAVPAGVNGPARTPVSIGGPKPAPIAGGLQPVQNTRPLPIPATLPRNRVLPQLPNPQAQPRRTLVLPRVPNN